MTWSASDGTAVKSGTRFGVVRGSALSILVAERIALNFMQRMSGIATATAEMVQVRLRMTGHQYDCVLRGPEFLITCPTGCDNQPMVSQNRCHTLQPVPYYGLGDVNLPDC